MSGTRLLLLSVEGVPRTTLLEWCDKMGLRHLQSLLDASPAIRLQGSGVSTMRWADLLTGRNAARHGIFGDRIVRALDPPVIALPTAESLRSEAIASVISRSGAAVALLNLPLTGPAEPLPNAVIVPGGLSKRHLLRQSAPSDIIQRLKGAAGLDIECLAVNVLEEESARSAWLTGDRETWLRLQVERNRGWRLAAEWLLRQTGFDLFWLNLDGIGRILEMNAHLCRSSELPGRLSDDLHETDAWIGRRLSEMASGRTMVLLSPYTWKEPSRFYRINMELERSGLLRWVDGSGQTGEDRSGIATRRAALPPIDFDRSAAAALAPGSGSVWVLDRAPEDVLSTVSRLESLFAEASAADPPLVRSVHFHEEPAVVGDRSETTAGLRPDFLVLPEEGVFIDTERSEGTGDFPNVMIGDGWMTAGADRPASEVPLRMVASSLLAALDIPVPSDWEDAALQIAAGPAKPARKGPPSRGGRAVEAASTAESDQSADEEITRRLKALGYIE